jgi:hypothetical protein
MRLVAAAAMVVNWPGFLTKIFALNDIFSSLKCS